MPATLPVRLVRFGIGSAAILAALSVAFGAFGAHALADVLDPGALQLWRTAMLYGLVHSLAMLGASAAHPLIARIPLTYALCAWMAGVLLFCGSLYALALGAPRSLGSLTPIGGVALITGWVALALGALRR